MPGYAEQLGRPMVSGDEENVRTLGHDGIAWRVPLLGPLAQSRPSYGSGRIGTWRKLVGVEPTLDVQRQTAVLKTGPDTGRD